MDENNPKNPEVPQKGEKKKNSGLIVLLFLSLAGNAALGYLFYKKHTEATEKTIVIANKTNELNETKKELESMEKVMKDQIKQLAELGQDTTEMAEQLRVLIKEKDRLLAQGIRDRRELKQLRQLKINYEMQLAQQEHDILKYKALAEALQKENVTLKETIVVKQDTIEKKNSIIRDQAATIDLAQILVAEQLQVTPIKSSGKPHKESSKGYKAKQIDKVEIKFNLAENKIADVETKEIIIQVKEPSGIPVYDLEFGSGEFKYQGKTQYYTVKEEVLYQRESTDVKAIWTPNNYIFKTGNYIVEIYAEGHMIGSGTFLVR